MIRRGSVRAPVEEPTVNLTPLIDVVFVILIMFIVVAPLLELERVELANAANHLNHSSISVQESSPISIHVLKDNSIRYQNRLVTLDELAGLLSQAKKQYPNAKPQLFHDKQAHFGIYQAVKNATEAAGFEQMDVVLKPS